MAAQNNKKIVYRKIHRYIKLLRENGIDIWRLYLFGSYATGRFNRDSDIDLAIFFDKDDIDGFIEDVQLMHLRRKVDLRIEPHSFARSDFKERDPFVKQIISSGERLI